ncbi:hypothetical protein [Arcticibacter tournemirensis]
MQTESGRVPVFKEPEWYLKMLSISLYVELTEQEFTVLRSQSATSKGGRDRNLYLFVVLRNSAEISLYKYFIKQYGIAFCDTI